MLFPTTDGELVLRIHLMSAGRVRYLEPGAKGPKTPAFRLAFEGGAELVLTEAGKKKRAGVWLVTPETLDAELAHLGPDALDLDAASLGAILRGESRRLHPFLRDQRLLAGIGRAHANEILLRARLSPFKLSAELTENEVEGLAAAMHADLVRALELRERGKGDKDVYAIHNRLGEPCSAVRHPDRARRFRGAHDLLLPDLPDRRPGAEGPAHVAAAPLTPSVAAQAGSVTTSVDPSSVTSPPSVRTSMTPTAAPRSF